MRKDKTDEEIIKEWVSKMKYCAEMEEMIDSGELSIEEIEMLMS